MVEDVEELGPELRGQTLLEFPVLLDRDIPVAEGRVAENILAGRAIGSVSGRGQRRIANRVAAVVKE